MLCSSCNRAFLKERDRHAVTRCCLNELTQALKFKHNLHESNYITIIKLILHDYGEAVGAGIDDKVMYVTNASECVSVYLQDFIDFVQDSHVLHRMKMMARESSALSEDTLGGELKAGLSKYIAYEIYRATSRDARSMYRYLPWLLSPPPITQLG
ncbi:unnamed protein product [Soboliphyme baturini]|uniref:RGS domain-containing protein n=1 Tax=Soboliphyme baturini TaxID=241478 RepID=A0A183I9X0_9BILA|nr:unnamed protein product [Soboliphyme baturini]